MDPEKLNQLLGTFSPREKQIYDALMASAVTETNKLGFCNEQKVLDILNNMNAKLITGKENKDVTHAREVGNKWIQLMRFKPGDVPAFVEQEKDFFTKTTNTSTLSGIIPTIILTKVLEAMQEAKWHRQLCQIIDIAGIEKTTYPVSTDGITAENKAQNVAGSESVPTFDAIAVATYEKKGLVLLPDKLIEVGPAGLVDLVSRLCANAILKLEFAEFINGTGTASWKGLDSYAFTEVDLSSGSLYERLLEMMGDLYDEDLANAIWIVYTTNWAKLFSVKDGSGRYLFDPLTNTMFGRPVKKHSTMGSTGLYLLNPQKYGIFDQRRIKVDITNAGYTLRTVGQTLFVPTSDSDGKFLGVTDHMDGCVKGKNFPSSF
jgi:HK97 family phage major capsid protein